MGDRGRIGWIGQAGTNQMLLKATEELFAEEGRNLHEGLLLEEGRCGLLRERVAVGGPQRGRQQIHTMKIHLKGERGRGEKRRGSRENNRTGGRGGGKKRGGLSEWWNWSSTMGGQFRGGRTPRGWRTGAGEDGGYERERGVSLKERTGESGEEMEGEWEGGGGRESGSGGMRAALRKDKGSDEASGDGSTAAAIGGPEKREVGFERI